MNTLWKDARNTTELEIDPKVLQGGPLRSIEYLVRNIPMPITNSVFHGIAHYNFREKKWIVLDCFGERIRPIEADVYSRVEDQPEMLAGYLQDYHQKVEK